MNPLCKTSVVLFFGLLSLGGCMGLGEQSQYSGEETGGAGLDPKGGGAGSPSGNVAGVVPAGSDEEPVGPFVPAPLRSRLLLGWQYRAAIAALLGDEAASLVTPPPDTAVNGFTAIGASQLSVGAAALAQYEKSAFLAAQSALSTSQKRTALVGCTPSGATDVTCLRSFLQRFGRLAFRRPLATEEVTYWLSVGQEAAQAYNDFYRGVEFLVAALLQSAPFLYQVELGEPDPSDSSRRRLTAYELANRMSFFLSGAPPSAALLDAAARGELATVEGVRTQALALLKAPTARPALRQFFDEFLSLRDLSQTSKDTSVFPTWGPTLVAAMMEETHLLLDDLIWERNADFRTAFDADYTFVNAALGQHYGLSGAPAQGFGRVALPAGSRRGGLLGHASFLSLKAHPASTSPTFRGKFIREKLLCQPLPPPPDNVVAELTSANSGNTMREKLSEHQTNPACAGCHTLMDNLGLALENFDAVGRYRDSDRGYPIDATSSADDLGTFTGARELGAALKANPRTLTCFSRSLFRAATGHVDLAGEQASLREVDHAFAQAGYRVQELLVALVTSEAFRTGLAAEGTP